MHNANIEEREGARDRETFAFSFAAQRPYDQCDNQYHFFARRGGDLSVVSSGAMAASNVENASSHLSQTMLCSVSTSLMGGGQTRYDTAVSYLACCCANWYPLNQQMEDRLCDQGSPLPFVKS